MNESKLNSSLWKRWSKFIESKSVEYWYVKKRFSLSIYFQTTGTKESLVDHVPPIGHANDEDIIQLFHAVNFGQQLIDDSVADAGAPTSSSASLANGVDFIEDDDVQPAVGSKLRIIQFIKYLIRQSPIFRTIIRW